MRLHWLAKAGLFALGCAAWVVPVSTDAQTVTPAESLLSAMRLWGDIRYLDPQIAGGEQRRWDLDFMQAEPQLRTATDRASYIRAIDRLLFSLKDPAASVDGSSPFRESDASDVFHPQVTVAANGAVSVVTISNAAAGPGSVSPFDAVPGNGAILFDLRSLSIANSAAQAYLDDTFSTDGALMALVRGDVVFPQVRTRSYVGYPPQGYGYDGYRAQFEIADAQTVPGTATQDRRLAFLVNGETRIPPAILGLALAGKATIYTTDRQPMVDAPKTASLDRAYGVTVRYRIGDFVGLGSGDAVATPVQNVSDAVVRMNQPPTAPLQLAHGDFPNEIKDDPYGGGLLFPDEPLRILAIARMYNIIRYFSPYVSLEHDDWDAAAKHAIDDEIVAANARDYLTAIMRFYAHLHDSHGNVTGDMVTHYYGASAPIAVRYLRHQAVITGFKIQNTAPATVRLGDIIDAINGVPTRRAMLQAEPLINSSTPQAADFAVLRGTAPGSLFAGTVDSRVTIRFHAPGSRTEMTATLVRSSGYSIGQTVEPLYTILPGNVGYVDLDRIVPSEVDAMFTALWKTSAIIFDNRGYPRAAAWTIAPRLARAARVPYALFSTPVVSEPIDSQEDDESFVPNFRRFVQSLVASDLAKYHKPTVMLIDARSVSQSEHSALMFRAVAGTRFVGSPTVGADGDVTSMVLPSNITLYFTGEGVQYADGRQLQRVGVFPDRWVEPSASDIAASDDVVLQAGLDEALRLSGDAVAARRGAALRERAREFALAHPPVAASGDSARGTGDHPLQISYELMGKKFSAESSATGGYSGGAQYSMRSVNGVDPSDKPFGSYAGAFDISTYVGKTIRIRGYLATEDVVGGAGFWVRIDGPQMQLDNMQNRWLHGTANWTPFTIVLHVPLDATKAFAGLLMSGTGSVRASNVHIDVVPDSTTSTETAM